MYILSKTNYQDFENNVECFKTLKEAQDAMQAYYEEDKKTVEMLVGDVDDADDDKMVAKNLIPSINMRRIEFTDVTLFISDYSATAHCEEFWMEYQIYDFSKPIDGSKTAK